MSGTQAPAGNPSGNGSLMSRIGSIFNPAPAANPNPAGIQQQPPSAAQIQTGAGIADPNAAGNNPLVPNATTPASTGTMVAIPAAGQGEKSPLAEYANLWQADPNAKPPTSITPALNFDATKMMEAARQVDFTKSIDPAILTAASKGDPAALATAISQATQAAIAQSAGITATILKQALTQQEHTLMTDVMPRLLREHNVNGAVAEGNPIFNNPAVAPMLSALESQLSAKYPTATAAEISVHAKSFLGGLAEEIVRGNGGQVLSSDGVKQAAKTGPAGQKIAPEQDWSNYFGMTA